MTFTSGGTEANALALAAQAGDAWHAICRRPSIPRCSPAAVLPREQIRIPVKDGVVDLDVLASELKRHAEGGGPVVSLMLANNETGVIQPVAEAANRS